MDDVMRVAQYAVIIRNGKALVLQFSDYMGEWYHKKWALPGGHLHEGEHPMDGIEREVKEETGLEMKNLRPLVTDREIYHSDGEPRVKIIYAASADGDVALSAEHIASAWIAPEELGDFVFTSRQTPKYIKLALEKG